MQGNRAVVQRLREAVFYIAHNRAIDLGQLHPDLMGPAGERMYAQQATPSLFRPAVRSRAGLVNIGIGTASAKLIVSLSHVFGRIFGDIVCQMTIERFGRCAHLHPMHFVSCAPEISSSSLEGFVVRAMTTTPLTGLSMRCLRQEERWPDYL